MDVQGGSFTAENHPSSVLSQASDLLDKLDHLATLNRAGAIFVELAEALIKVIIVESCAICHIGQCVLYEALRLLLVEIAVVVIVVLGPDLVDALADNVVNL